jgi:hypothetical protein
MLVNDFIRPIYAGNSQPSTLTTKGWAAEFHAVRGYSSHDTELDTLNTVLGDEWDDDERRIDQPFGTHSKISQSTSPLKEMLLHHALFRFH